MTGALGAVLAAAACGDEPTVVRDIELTEHAVAVGDAARSYLLYESEVAHDGPRPLVLVFHGAAQPAASVALMSWMYPVADDEGLLVAYPRASGAYWNTPNSPPASWNVNDLAFVDAVVDDVDAARLVDRSRVYVMGFSNGAIFAQVVACSRSERIAGLSVIGASAALQVSQGCPFQRPVPTTVFLGDRDPQFLWHDDLAYPTGMLGANASAKWWAQTNGCGEVADTTLLPDIVDDGTTVERWIYPGCPAEAEFNFHRIRGGGHTWPGSPVNLENSFGQKTRDIDASRYSVEFFLRHALGGGA